MVRSGGAVQMYHLHVERTDLYIPVENACLLSQRQLSTVRRSGQVGGARRTLQPDGIQVLVTSRHGVI